MMKLLRILIQKMLTKNSTCGTPYVITWLKKLFHVNWINILRSFQTCRWKKIDVMWRQSQPLPKRWNNIILRSDVDVEIPFLRRGYFFPTLQIDERCAYRRQHVKLANVVAGIALAIYFFVASSGRLSLNLCSFIGRHPDLSPFFCYRRAF